MIMSRHRTTSKALVLASVAVLAALSAGCASGVGPSTGGAGSGALPGTAVSSDQATGTGPVLSAGRCPTSSTDPAVAMLRAEPAEVAPPADFHAVAVVRCVTEERAVPDDGVWKFALAQRADSRLAAFLSALRLSSQSPPTGSPLACTAVGLALPPFALVDASGAIVRPRLPHDACGMPLPAVLTALAALPWRTEAEQKLTQLQTRQEVDTGCAPAYKDLFDLRVGGTPLPWSRTRRSANPEPTAVCAYTVAPTGATIGVGTFTHGVKLTTAQQAQLVGALDLASDIPAPTCAKPATRLAVMTGPGVDGLAVELDGCHRLQLPDGFVGTAPTPLLRALAAAGITG
jgi:hypothetical protein